MKEQPGKVIVLKVERPDGKIESRCICGVRPSVATIEVEKFVDDLEKLTDCEIISWELLEAQS